MQKNMPKMHQNTSGGRTRWGSFSAPPNPLAAIKGFLLPRGLLHSPCDLHQDVWRHNDESSLCHVIGKCAQSPSALKLLRHHGMGDDSLRHVHLQGRRHFQVICITGMVHGTSPERPISNVLKHLYDALSTYNSDDQHAVSTVC